MINKIIYIFCNSIFKILTEYGNAHIFNITKGDKKQQEKFRKEEKHDRKKIAWNFGITVFLNILCGVITYYITKGK